MPFLYVCFIPYSPSTDRKGTSVFPQNNVLKTQVPDFNNVSPLLGIEYVMTFILDHKILKL